MAGPPGHNSPLSARDTESLSIDDGNAASVSSSDEPPGSFDFRRRRIVGRRGTVERERHARRDNDSLVRVGLRGAARGCSVDAAVNRAADELRSGDQRGECLAPPSLRKESNSYVADGAGRPGVMLEIRRLVVQLAKPRSEPHGLFPTEAGADPRLPIQAFIGSLLRDPLLAHRAKLEQRAGSRTTGPRHHESDGSDPHQHRDDDPTGHGSKPTR